MRCHAENPAGSRDFEKFSRDSAGSRGIGLGFKTLLNHIMICMEFYINFISEVFYHISRLPLTKNKNSGHVLIPQKYVFYSDDEEPEAKNEPADDRAELDSYSESEPDEPKKDEKIKKDKPAENDIKQPKVDKEKSLPKARKTRSRSKSPALRMDRKSPAPLRMDRQTSRAETRRRAKSRSRSRSPDRRRRSRSRDRRRKSRYVTHLFLQKFKIQFKVNFP